MTDKQLKRLSRVQLLELLVEQGKENERLQQQLELAEEKLKSRELLIKEAGSVAEAALRLNGVFEAAQAAADQYLQNIQRMYGGSADAGINADPMDAETAGIEIADAETTGIETTGAETTDAETTGIETTDVETTGAETTGAETTGIETTDVETTGAETTGSESKKIESEGPDEAIEE